MTGHSVWHHLLIDLFILLQLEVLGERQVACDLSHFQSPEWVQRLPSQLMSIRGKKHEPKL